ncbi:GGDEF domain-containing protein [Kineococcus rhizosphaerae]|nr:GGDEF domain-containing protein [Kineococcus rhizosphaerae]
MALRHDGARAYRVHLVVAAVVVPAYVALPNGPARAVLNSLLGLAFAALIAVGVRRNRPRAAGAWWLLAAGVLAWVLGDITYNVLDHVLHVSPFPSVADVFYLAAYPLLAAGLLLLARRRTAGGDRDGVVDSAIVTVGAGLLSWVFLMQPSLADSTVPVFNRVVATSYPVGDVLLLAVVARLLTTAGRRSPSFRWLAVGIVLMLASDSAYQVVSLSGTYHGGLLNLGWSWSYAALAAAALHPSMRGLADAAPSAATFTRVRLVALTCASLLSPGTLLLQSALGWEVEPWSVGASSIALFLLVVLRMNGLLKQVQTQAQQLTALARTDGLTGIANRRSGDAELGRLVDRCALDGVPLAVAILDLDHFKRFNDSFGHPAGDELLVQAARAWTERLEDSPAFLARWGGEEFLVATTGLGAGAAADLVRALLGATPLGQTFSAGVAQWDGAESVTALVGRADAALYAAKAAGRNRVEVAAGGTSGVVPVQR